MGWTFYTTHRTAKDECDHINNRESDTRRWRVLDSAMVGSTYYAAVEITDKATGAAFVLAAVFLTQGRAQPGQAQDGCNFGYKSQDETMGPNEIDCPVRILDKLTPTTDRAFPPSRWAQEWRDKCRDKAKVRKSVKRRILAGAMMG